MVVMLFSRAQRASGLLTPARRASFSPFLFFSFE
jgi:hypothetical protein